MTLYKKETEDLETHVSICQERYQQLDDRLSKLEEVVYKIAEDIVENNKSLKNTIITASSGIIVSVVGLAATLIAK